MQLSHLILCALAACLAPPSSSSMQADPARHIRRAGKLLKPGPGGGGSSQPRPAPNFVLILTDDQDALQGSTHPRIMPNLHHHMRSQGVEFEQYFVSTPICCPSRTTLWRGQFAHNTNFTDVLGPHGGYSKWKALGIDDSYLPVWLQQLGYNTFHVGKFIVDYSVQNCNNTPRGWTDFDALVMPFTFNYFTPTFSRNGRPPLQYPGQYSTDVIADKAVAQIRTAAAAGKPFFAQVAPAAPHKSAQFSNDPATGKQTASFFPPLPAPRHWHLFSDATLPWATPRGNLYEQDVSDKPAWIRALPLLAQSNRTYLEEDYRLRLRSLVAVDELIGRVVQTLNDTGQLGNTYLIYTSDNGYHIGTHRFGAGKTLSYEEELRVPFLIRGPGIVPTLAANPHVGLHVDLAPSILKLAGGTAEGKDLDGTELPLRCYSRKSDTNDGDGLVLDKGDTDSGGGLPPDNGLRPLEGRSSGNESRGDAGDVWLLPGGDTGPEKMRHRNQFQAEFWGGWKDELLGSLPRFDNNTCKSVRAWDPVSRQGYKLIVSCSGERELYDLKADPGEMGSLHDEPSSRQLRARLEGLLAVLAVCKGDSCVNPWKLLHPDGAVADLWDAMHSRYDDYYAAVQPFEFKRCLPYQDVSNEVSVFRGRVSCSSAAQGRLRGRGSLQARQSRPSEQQQGPLGAQHDSQPCLIRFLDDVSGASYHPTAARHDDSQSIRGSSADGLTAERDSSQPPPVAFRADVEQYGVPLPSDFEWDVARYLTVENRYEWA